MNESLSVVAWTYVLGLLVFTAIACKVYDWVRHAARKRRRQEALVDVTTNSAVERLKAIVDSMMPSERHDYALCHEMLRQSYSIGCDNPDHGPDCSGTLVPCHEFVHHFIYLNMQFGIHPLLTRDVFFEKMCDCDPSSGEYVFWSQLYNYCEKVLS